MADTLSLTKAELDAQRDRGEWSGTVDQSGGPVYTLAEIAKAVVRELRRSGGH